MNTQLQSNRPAAGEPSPRSSARAAPAARTDALAPAAAAEDRLPSPGDQHRVDPLWMITAAAALLFVFLVAVVSFD